MWMLPPINLPDHAFFSPMSTDSPRIPHRASNGYKRDSVNRALDFRAIFDFDQISHLINLSHSVYILCTLFQRGVFDIFEDTHASKVSFSIIKQI